MDDKYRVRFYENGYEIDNASFCDEDFVKAKIKARSIIKKAIDEYESKSDFVYVHIDQDREHEFYLLLDRTTKTSACLSFVIEKEVQ